MSRGSALNRGAVAVVGVALLMVPLCAAPPGGQGAAVMTLKNPVAPSAASVTAGAAVYRKYCRFCHGDDAKGNGTLAPKGTFPSDLTDATWDHGSTDGEIFISIRDGVGPKFDMKPQKDRLAEQDIWHSVNYLRSLAAGKT